MRRDGDGGWDTDFSTTKTASHAYAAAGVYAIALEVRDTAGNSAYVTRTVAVAAPGDVITVDTAVDENASPGSGTSLREAINLANAGSGTVIRFSGPMDIRLNAGGSLGRLPILTGDVAIVAAGDVSIDGTNLPADANLGDCLWISGGTGGGRPLRSLSRARFGIWPGALAQTPCRRWHEAERARILSRPREGVR